MKIGTHSGHFHADEALACFFLKQLPEFASAEIVRSRDNKILDTCDIVVDVGARFEPENKRFDHHQREFSETMKTLKVLNFETKLSSAGLIYAYYGKAVLSQMTGLAQDSPKLELIFEKVRKKLPETGVQSMDQSIARNKVGCVFSILHNVSQHYGVVLGVVFDMKNQKKLFTSAGKCWNQSKNAIKVFDPKL